MPTPVTDLGNPYINLLHALWMATREDLRGEGPIFGHVPTKYRGLPPQQRATIEKEIARKEAEAFLRSDHFNHWVDITSSFTDTQLDPEEFRKALYADN